MTLSADELEHVSRSLGDRAVTTTGEAWGRYTAPQADHRLVEGVSPTFEAAQSELDAAGITRSSRIESITTSRGAVVGPFKVTAIRQRDELGGFVELGLEVTA